MSGATIAPALPAIHAHFSGVENADLLVRLVLTIPALFIALGAPLAGLVVDRVGRKPMLVGSTVLYVVAGGSGYVLATLPGILAGRALLGIAVAGVMTSATTLIADYYTGDRRDGMLGLQAAFMSLGGVVFLPLGGFLADIGWRVPFLIYVSAAALVPLMVLSVYEPTLDGTDPRPDPTTCDPATGVPVSHPDDGPGTSVSDRVPVRAIAIAYLAALVTMVAFYMVPVQIPFYLETLAPVSASAVGLAIAGMTLTSGVVSTQFHALRAHLGARTIAALVFGLMGIGYVVIGTGSGYYRVVVGLAITGVGLGLLFPNLNSWLADHAPEASRGRVLGGLTSAVFLGQFLSPFLTQPVVTQVGLGKGYSVFGIVLLALCVAVLGTRLPGRLGEMASVR
ncbi:major facilitator superfamily protein [Halalkalicoccus jeotgali B3]|uniref:Major facilitator superfamily MFS_1 n=2 Tax=Halalkalicoccus jeotgali TaxID=413810 RepID=D8J461_HALJB|nr:MFS transporter [Halalkalicoccus jeotgali]ADJ15453.1 major facilitator superfamily MFS_1 [Halalkalicoccus jeotgali B3]ELY36138.1 major facilitator superfamily protein [Halalkalicoccus jeotgali B3]